MPEDIKRMRYYNGLFLQEEEFQLEQEYNVRMRRLHNARLHSKGIVWGLDVEIGSIADTVIVKQGMALDYYFDAVNSEYQGREIIVVADKPVDLSEYAGGDEVWLWIRYDESPAGDDPDRGEFPFNTIESFQVEHSLTRPVDEDLNIVLARIVVNPADTIDANSIRYDEAVTGNPIRFGAGFGGPRVETDVLTLRAPTIAAPWAYMTGNEFQPGGEVGINVVSERTLFTGPIDVEGDASVQNDLTVQNDVTVQGNATVQLNTQLNGTLDVAGDVTLQQNTQVLGNLSLTGTIDSANASGALEIMDDVHVTGNLSLLVGPAVSEISTDGTLADNSDTAIPTEQAVRTFTESRIANFATSELVGSVVAFAMQTPPPGWLECDGAEVSRSTYADLFARIGDAYGAGDGSTTFLLPDLRGEFVRGWDHGRLVDSGRVFASSQLDQVQGHGHNTSLAAQCGQDVSPFAGLKIDGTGSYPNLIKELSSDGVNGTPRTGPETRPRNVALIYCIRY